MISPFLQKLLFINQFEIGKGRVSMLGENQIMISSSAILELQEIDESKMYNLAKKSSKKDISSLVEHAKVYKKMKDVFLKELGQLGEKVKGSDDGAITTLQNIFNIYGLGEMTIENIDNKGNKATVIIKESTLADEWLKKSKKKSGKVCTLTAGVIAGMFSYVFGKDVNCTESKCRALGNGSCVFIVS